MYIYIYNRATAGPPGGGAHFRQKVERPTFLGSPFRSVFWRLLERVQAVFASLRRCLEEVSGRILGSFLGGKSVLREFLIF